MLVVGLTFCASGASSAGEAHIRGANRQSSHAWGAQHGRGIPEGEQRRNTEEMPLHMLCTPGMARMEQEGEAVAGWSNTVGGRYITPPDVDGRQDIPRAQDARSQPSGPVSVHTPSAASWRGKRRDNVCGFWGEPHNTHLLQRCVPPTKLIFLCMNPAYNVTRHLSRTNDKLHLKQTTIRMQKPIANGGPA